jgi:hypothetical protein
VCVDVPVGVLALNKSSSNFRGENISLNDLELSQALFLNIRNILVNILFVKISEARVIEIEQFKFKAIARRFHISASLKPNQPTHTPSI